MKLKKFITLIREIYEGDEEFNVIGITILDKDSHLEVLLDDSPEDKVLLDYEDKMCLCAKGEKVKIFLQKNEH